MPGNKQTGCFHPASTMAIRARLVSPGPWEAKSRFSRNPAALADSVRASHRRPKPASNRPARFRPASRQLPASFPPASRQLPASFPPASRQLPASFPPASREVPAKAPTGRARPSPGSAPSPGSPARSHRTSAAKTPRAVLEPSPNRPRGIRPVVLLCAQRDTLSSWAEFPTAPAWLTIGEFKVRLSEAAGPRRKRRDRCRDLRPPPRRRIRPAAALRAAPALCPGSLRRPIYLPRRRLFRPPPRRRVDRLGNQRTRPAARGPNAPPHESSARYPHRSGVVNGTRKTEPSLPPGHHGSRQHVLFQRCVRL